MARFASTTSVPVERSQAEIQRLLRNHGASTVATVHQKGGAAVAFEIGAYRVRLELSVPSVKELWEKTDKQRPKGWFGWDSERKQQWCEDQIEQIERQRWRALLLVTKAKLELVAEGASTIEREFMADLLLPNGQRAAQWLLPQLAEAPKRMPPLLPGVSR